MSRTSSDAEKLRPRRRLFDAVSIGPGSMAAAGTFASSTAARAANGEPLPKPVTADTRSRTRSQPSLLTIGCGPRLPWVLSPLA